MNMNASACCPYSAVQLEPRPAACSSACSSAPSQLLRDLAESSRRKLGQAHLAVPGRQLRLATHRRLLDLALARGLGGPKQCRRVRDQHARSRVISRLRFASRAVGGTAQDDGDGADQLERPSDASMNIAETSTRGQAADPYVVWAAPSLRSCLHASCAATGQASASLDRPALVAEASGAASSRAPSRVKSRPQARQLSRAEAPVPTSAASSP